MSDIHCRPGGEVHSGGGCSPSPVASESESDHFENSNTRPGAWLEGDDPVHRIERNSRPERAGGLPNNTPQLFRTRPEMGAGPVHRMLS